MNEIRSNDRSPSSAPPSSSASSERPSEQPGDIRRVIRAIDPSEVAVSPEDLAAISIRAQAPPQFEDFPSFDEGFAPLDENTWDPMQSFAKRDSSGPPSSDSRDQKTVSETGITDSSLRESPRSAADRVGGLLAGRYELRRLIGEGGMAAVFEAFDRERKLKVALKLMHPGYAKNVEMIGRFRREARAASAVPSDHIVRILDVGKARGAGLYMVMELLKGEDLSRVIPRAGRLRPEVACTLAAHAASGLFAAHAGMVIHRDIKPANLFLVRAEDETVRLKILDFGVAKPEYEDTEALTRVGTVIGTPQYMAPEQARAEKDIGARVDVYALGAVLFEMLTGRPAFAEKENVLETLADVAQGPIPRVSSVVKDIAPAIDALVADMMCPEPELRLGDMGLVLDRLRALGATPDTALASRDFESTRSKDARRTSARTNRAAETVASASLRAPTTRKSLPQWLYVAIAIALAVTLLIARYVLLR